MTTRPDPEETARRLADAMQRHAAASTPAGDGLARIEEKLMQTERSARSPWLLGGLSAAAALVVVIVLAATLTGGGDGDTDVATDVTTMMEAMFDGLSLTMLIYPEDATRADARRNIRSYLAATFPGRFVPPEQPL